MSMNRVFFIILLFAFLVVPLSINIVNDDEMSYFNLVAEVNEKLFENSNFEREGTGLEKQATISLSDEQKQLISKQLQALTKINNSIFNNFEEIQNENLKGVNEYISLYRWQEFSSTYSCIKGIYLTGFHFLR